MMPLPKPPALPALPAFLAALTGAALPALPALPSPFIGIFFSPYFSAYHLSWKRPIVNWLLLAVHKKQMLFWTRAEIDLIRGDY
jgi:hypothetical protein